MVHLYTADSGWLHSLRPRGSFLSGALYQYSYHFYYILLNGIFLKKNMRAENIVKVANAFGVSTDYLLTGKPSNSELNDFASKNSVLDEQEMDLLQQIIELLIMACKKDR